MTLFSKRSKAANPFSTKNPPIKALLFDTFGTTVDWLSSMTAHAEAIGREAGVQADWKGLVLDWRDHYQPAIKPVREGKRPWAGFDELHREQLDKIVRKHGAGKLTIADRDRLTLGWHALKAWPEVPAALHRLNRQFIIGPLSNGPLRQMVDLARYAGLPWSVVFGADMFRTYKPAPALYLGAIAFLQLRPEEVLMVAAHNQDLQAAQKQGMRTCFVHRPTEDTKVEGEFDYVVDDFEHLARTLNAV